MRVEVSAPSRIHLTLVDLHGSFSGRIDGGAGFSLNEPRFVASVEPSSGGFGIDIIGGDGQDRSEGEVEILALLKRMSQIHGFPAVNVRISAPLGSHAGLGSKTAILLSVCQAYLALFKKQLSALEMAKLVGRGGTSCIGVHGFHTGGFIVDCGHSFSMKGETFRISGLARDVPPGPLIGRYHMPEWPMLLITPNARKIHGRLEQQYFESVCPIPLEDVRTVCHTIMMILIPAVIEDDIETFSQGVRILQTCRWKSHQISCQTEVIRKVMDRLTDMGLSGVGMSSWGSSVVATGAALNSVERSHSIIKDIKQLMDREDGGSCILTRACNVGRQIRYA